MLVVLLAQLALAQDQRPLPTGSPDLVVGRSVVVHVIASEDLEPDVLRVLARPLVTLWLTTRSNTLRDSTLTTLSRFEASFVQLRAPLSKVDGQAMAAAPRAGFWLRPDPRWPEVLRRWRGSRAVALDLEGPLDEALAATAALVAPTRVRWRPTGPVDVLEWARFRQLGPRRSVEVTPDFLLARDCGDRLSDEASAELHVATLLAVSAGVFPCGKGTRVEVPPDIDRWLLTSLLARDPSIELSVTVGDDVRKVGAARRLLEALGR
ncbi:MAG: hypothetical protein SFW67_32525 [Myxococcaceae bacterium]|nr:hypothetical protein [Myxococcaceae bacterium]